MIDHLRKKGVKLVSIRKLKPHEAVSEKDLNRARNSLLNKNKGILKLPIVCDKKRNIIIDGHCRYTLFKEMGIEKIPVFYVDYYSPKIIVRSWGKGPKVRKKDVLKVVSLGKVFPPKTTKHAIVSEKGKLVHISKFVPRISIPIKMLKKNH